MRYIALVVILLVPPLVTIADQTVISNYAATQDHIFWDQLYPGGGSTLYCNQVFRTLRGPS